MRTFRFRAWVKPLQKMAQVYTLGLTGIEGTTVSVDGQLRCGLDWRTMELMQFAGLLDKNGKEIWEGDIVRYRDEIGDVRWSHRRCGFRVFVGHKKPQESKTYSVAFTGGEVNPNIEVIGNIYEDDYLLNQSK